jgi:hypothetical protein
MTPNYHTVNVQVSDWFGDGFTIVMLAGAADHSSGAGGDGGLSPNHLFLTML